MKVLVVLFGIFFLCIPLKLLGATNAILDEKTFNEIVNNAKRMASKREFDKAEKMLLPYAEAGDPRAQYVLGFLTLARPDKNKPTFERAFHWIYSSVKGGYLFGVTEIKSGFLLGRYGFPKDQDLSQCWQRASYSKTEEAAKKVVKTCFDLENKKYRGPAYKLHFPEERKKSDGCQYLYCGK